MLDIVNPNLGMITNHTHNCNGSTITRASFITVHANRTHLIQRPTDSPSNSFPSEQIPQVRGTPHMPFQKDSCDHGTERIDQIVNA